MCHPINHTLPNCVIVAQQITINTDLGGLPGDGKNFCLFLSCPLDEG